MIPDDERIGDVDQGWTVARTMLVFERGGSTAAPPKAPPEPGPLAPDLVQIAEAFGRADDPEARQLVARGHSRGVLRRVLDRRLAKAMSRSGGDAGIAAYGKLTHGTFDSERALIGMELAQGGGIAWDEPEGTGASAALTFLNGRINSIAGGSDQMQRNGISEQVLGLPREPSWDRDKPFDQVLRDAQNWDGHV